MHCAIQDRQRCCCAQGNVVWEARGGWWSNGKMCRLDNKQTDRQADWVSKWMETFCAQGGQFGQVWHVGCILSCWHELDFSEKSIVLCRWRKSPTWQCMRLAMQSNLLSFRMDRTLSEMNPSTGQHHHTMRIIGVKQLHILDLWPIKSCVHNPPTIFHPCKSCSTIRRQR